VKSDEGKPTRRGDLAEALPKARRASGSDISGVARSGCVGRGHEDVLCGSWDKAANSYFPCPQKAGNPNYATKLSPAQVKKTRPARCDRMGKRKLSPQGKIRSSSTLRFSAHMAAVYLTSPLIGGRTSTPRGMTRCARGILDDGATAAEVWSRPPADRLCMHTAWQAEPQTISAPTRSFRWTAPSSACPSPR